MDLITSCLVKTLTNFEKKYYTKFSDLVGGQAHLEIVEDEDGDEPISLVLECSDLDVEYELYLEVVIPDKANISAVIRKTSLHGTDLDDIYSLVLSDYKINALLYEDGEEYQTLLEIVKVEITFGYDSVEAVARLKIADKTIEEIMGSLQSDDEVVVYLGGDVTFDVPVKISFPPLQYELAL
jgi:hypothetical protein